MDKNKRKRSTKLSERERRFVQLVAEGRHCLSRCLLMSGYSRTTAISQAARIRRRPRVQKAIIEERIKRGLFCSNEELALVGKSSDGRGSN